MLSTLINLGNTCYMNALFQALRFLPPFIKYLDKTKTLSKIGKYIYDILYPLNLKYCSLKPETFIYFLKNHTKFRMQEDPHELFLYILDNIEIPGTERNPFYIILQMKLYGNNQKEFIRDECMNSLTTNKNIPEFFQVENISHKIFTKKQYTIRVFPKVLCVQFKKGICKKQVPKKFMLYQQQYILKSNVLYWNNHYTAQVFVNETWYEFNDNQVHKKDLNVYNTYLAFFLAKS